MKKQFYIITFAVGLALGLSFKPVQVFVSYPDRAKSFDKCTCAICLPDHFCEKCGHKSRECPRLQWYFSKTNLVSRLTNRVERVKGVHRE